MKGNPVIGYTVGTGVAKNIELGFVPDWVEIYNMTDGDLITSACLIQVIPFSSGGTREVLPGDTIVGVTSGAKAVIQSVLLASGSWAAGTAAGFFVLRNEPTPVLQGTFGSENVVVQSAAGATDDATVTVNSTYNVATAAAAASATGNSALSRYEGVAGSNAKGFTIGSTVAEAGKALAYRAWREA